jgi:glycosyltransferase involved in cell wall biosynthesis
MFDLTIITVNKDNKDGLIRTQKSISSILANPNFRIEWIVVDGNSTDGSIGIINPEVANQIVEDNNGVYSAMNKGVEQSNGSRIFFLNSGDVVSSNLPIIFKYPANKILFFDSFYFDRFNRKKKANKRHKCYGMPSSHQGLIFPNTKNTYNTLYIVCADYDYYLSHNYEEVYVPCVTSLCEKFGLSFSRPGLIVKEMFLIRRRHCGITTALFILPIDFFKMIVKSVLNRLVNKKRTNS